METDPQTTITVRLPRVMLGSLKQVAKTADLSVSQLIRRHLAEGLKRSEVKEEVPV